jgi:hypothetical protein
MRNSIIARSLGVKERARGSGTGDRSGGEAFDHLLCDQHAGTWPHVAQRHPPVEIGDLSELGIRSLVKEELRYRTASKPTS